MRPGHGMAQWDALVARWHPLGFQGAFGYRLRDFITTGVTTGGRQLGCLLLSGAVRAVGVRDGLIGWTVWVRHENLPQILNNRSFLSSRMSGCRLWPVMCS
ncbi:MAG TPA: DUF4338 domain-containing protein [Accumulibacter sp.]|nr:Druantia anti-phage system protein DruA [Accumulibacter sp.]HMW55677.1 DUF4338 domain-containing protein [Accumulibacter sp.]